ncbi:MAG: RNA polymerase sigma factor [Candidatus Levybacteria bacterium GW2011_GWB1_39_7]|nr:MAG: RNA polymerase sigma factor [Candidatus Levybacteria bacterium GW2011_GWA1_39_11]KKR24745.1 MAG: RNA polymerase sigma factor [Candidatus Levybacteria bacterium GW2011_GWB1_39_7]
MGAIERGILPISIPDLDLSSNGGKTPPPHETDNEPWESENGGRSNLSSIGLHKLEAKQCKVPPEENKELGVRIFDGRLALMALRCIAESGLASPVQHKGIERILKDNTANFLATQSNLAINEVTARLAADRYMDEDRRRQDEKFIEIVNAYRNKTDAQLESIQKISDGKLKEEALERMIEHERELAACGIAAWKKMVEGNLGLAFAWAKRYRDNYDARKELSELVSLAEEGLMVAAARYDYNRGFQFSTYASEWITERIIKGTMNSGLIRVPTHVQEDIAKQRRNGQPLQKQGKILAARRAQNPLSLDKPAGYGMNSNLSEIIPCETQDLDEEIDRTALREVVRMLLQTLPPRERLVIQLRFGINDGIERVLGEIGQEFGFTRERARQIEAEALRKLRTSVAIERLIPFRETDPRATKATAATVVGIRRPRKRKTV